MSYLAVNVNSSTLRALSEVLDEGLVFVPAASPLDALTILPPTAASGVIMQCDQLNAGSEKLVRELVKLGYTGLILICSSTSKEWEERIYLAGVEHVFVEPIRFELFRCVLARTTRRYLPVMIEPRQAVQPSEPSRLAQLCAFLRTLRASPTSPDATGAFFGLIRDMLSLNRAAYFEFSETHIMVCRYSVGVLPELTAVLRLSSKSGLGVLLRATHQTYNLATLPTTDIGAAAARELRSFGMQWAVPVAVNGHQIGLFLVGTTSSGRLLQADEIEFVFFLLEEFARAVEIRRNVLACGAEIVEALPCAAVVLSPTLDLVHANAKARSLLSLEPMRNWRPDAELEANIQRRSPEGVCAGRAVRITYTAAGGVLLTEHTS